jgi:hypothetical protein
LGVHRPDSQRKSRDIEKGPLKVGGPGSLKKRYTKIDKRLNAFLSKHRRLHGGKTARPIGHDSLVARIFSTLFTIRQGAIVSSLDDGYL